MLSHTLSKSSISLVGNSLAVTLRRFWNNEWFRTGLVVLLIAGTVFGLWFGSQAVLGTKITPVLAVISGSMCVPYGGYACDGWVSIMHPFERTLHKGDLIIIQNIDPNALNIDYPNSDIIVYHRPDDRSELIVHRLVDKIEIDGELYFFTQGDGNPPVDWPNVPPGIHDNWMTNNPNIPIGAINQDLVEGKVIMRIPWLGWLPIIVQENGLSSLLVPVIAIVIILLIIVEFIIPLLKKKKQTAAPVTEA